MAQSRFMSLVEVITGSVIAFAVSIWANWAVLPLFGFRVRLDQSFAITAIFTVISLVRSYLVRRLFEVYVKRIATWCQDDMNGGQTSAGKIESGEMLPVKNGPV
jgi:hypothetical protein